MQEYDIVIGLEIHVQLKTKSKMFCSSSSQYFGEEANTHLCPTCLGLPGALPVVNKEAIKNAVKVGLALNCHINLENKFDRKSYFYPDLPKGYQISQFDQPISVNGWVLVGDKKVRINRAHMEEDTGKLIHSEVKGKRVSLIDFNRSGVPLLEIVSEPDLSSPEEARVYAKKIHQIMRYLEVADVDMEKAGMRFDANVSIKPKGVKELGTKVEIKNINSFSFLEKALVFEVGRQVKAKEEEGKIIQETRGWVETRGETVSQRSKETSPDYRYFPEPDLPVLEFNQKEIEEIKKTLVELPEKKKERFISSYTLSDLEASTLIEEKELADWYEKALADYVKIADPKVGHSQALKAKKVANWVIGEVRAYLNQIKLSSRELKTEPAQLAELLLLIDRGEVSIQAAKAVFAKVLETGEMPVKILQELGLQQESNESKIEEIIVKVIATNEKAVSDYRGGKENALDFMFGQIMRETKGAANPEMVRQILKKNLS